MSHVAEGEGEASRSTSYEDLPGLQAWVVAQLKQLSKYKAWRANR